MPKITHVAIRFQGTTYSLPAPNRHHDLIRKISEETGQETVTSMGDDQGFIDEEGTYLTRRQALTVAEREGQLKEGALGTRLGRLFSEDVW